MHLKKSKNTYEYKRLQCLKLRAEKNMKLKEIGEIVGYNHKTVNNIIARYFKEGIDSMLGEKRKGGNKRNFTQEQENIIINPYIEEAYEGKMLVVKDIQRAYEKAMGRKVPSSTVYRMLKRHNWRKIMPRSKHPKANHEMQEAYKKNPLQDNSTGKYIQQ